MKVIVTLNKSFSNDVWRFAKEFERGDFKELFEREVEYVEALTESIKEVESGGFTITYTITVKK